MRLTGVLSGSVTYRDRPHWLGEIFDLGAEPEQPDVSPWTNLAAAGTPACQTNLAAAGGAGWTNLAAAGSAAWGNAAGSTDGGYY
jgi:hypothetical protein